MATLKEQPSDAQFAPGVEPDLLVIGGGKGGVGKTCLAVNLAVHVAQKGWRTVLVDADLSCSNVETVLGVEGVQRLDDFFLSKGRKSLEPILCDTHFENLRFVPGTTGLLDVANPRYQQKQAFIRELRQLQADLVIIDLDAGAHLNTLDIFLLAETNGILVLTPEKTSIDNAFKFLRAALYRRIERFYQSQDVALLLKRTETLPAFLACLSKAEAFERSTRDTLCSEILALAHSIRPHIVVNRARNSYEAQIAANIFCKHARRDLEIEPHYLGHLAFDPCVQDAINSSQPFVVSHADSPIAGCVADVATRLGYI